jgi:transcriptional regulator with XRE-family HTH domain
VTASLHNARYRHFVQLLIDGRKKSGLSQRTVANALGKPQSYVAKYEGFERRLDVFEYVQVAEIVGVEVRISRSSEPI